jgi:hypothetical protein
MLKWMEYPEGVEAEEVIAVDVEDPLVDLPSDGVGVAMVLGKVHRAMLKREFITVRAVEVKDVDLEEEEGVGALRVEIEMIVMDLHLNIVAVAEVEVLAEVIAMKNFGDEDGMRKIPLQKNT